VGSATRSRHAKQQADVKVQECFANALHFESLCSLGFSGGCAKKPRRGFEFWKQCLKISNHAMQVLADFQPCESSILSTWGSYLSVEQDCFSEKKNQAVFVCEEWAWVCSDW
jgi:hypothetical protein